jgi:hypothetical protein
LILIAALLRVVCGIMVGGHSYGLLKLTSRGVRFSWHAIPFFTAAVCLLALNCVRFGK